MAGADGGGWTWVRGGLRRVVVAIHGWRWYAMRFGFGWKVSFPLSCYNKMRNGWAKSPDGSNKVEAKGIGMDKADNGGTEVRSD